LTRDDDAIVAIRARVNSVVAEDALARYAPQPGSRSMNAWMNRAWLQERLQIPGGVNVIALGASEHSQERVQSALRKHWRLADLQSALVQAPQGLRLITNRVLLDEELAEAASRVDPGALGLLSWLGNSLELNERTSPYGILTAIGRLHPGSVHELPAWAPQIASEAIAINAWTANDLQAREGDALTLRYSTLGRSRAVHEAHETLTVSRITPMEGPLADPSLLPPIPGISDAESCQDWAPGLPIDLDRMRPADEAYWKKYRGTPRAFIALETGQRLWGSVHGDLTAVAFGDTFTDPALVEAALLEEADPVTLGLSFEDVRGAALARAEPASDFGGLFIGFNLFLVLAALLLTSLLTALAMESRSAEMGGLLAMGWPPARVRRLLQIEVALAALAGVLLGIPLARLVTEAVLMGLSGMWSGATPGTPLRHAVESSTLMLGAGTTWFLSVATANRAIAPLLRRSATALLQRHAGRDSSSDGPRRGLLGTAALSATAAIFLVGSSDAAPAFFGAGALALIAILATTSELLHRGARITGDNLMRLAFAAMSRRHGRSMAAIALLGAGSFLVIGVGAGHMDPLASDGSRRSGTGGFAWIGETTLPIPHDLQTPEGRARFHLTDADLPPDSFVPVRVWDGDDASCLSLGQARTPTLLGVTPQDLAQRDAFAFAEGGDGPSGWELLEGWKSGDPIPAIGDEATLRWQLHLGVGDILTYRASDGDPFDVVLVGMVRNALFQGSLVVPDDALAAMHPDLGGIRQIWFDPPSEGSPAPEEAWMDRLADVGLALTPARERFAALVEVERTYLGIFETLGGLGLLLGSLGLGLVIARNVADRRQELASLMAIGFSPIRLRWLLFAEHGALALAGITAGSLAALLAVFPAIQAHGMHHAMTTTLTLAIALILSGSVAMGAAVTVLIRPEMTATLRGD
jgi:ABC-type antimicrobial peptide transport system permease subunit